MEDTVTVTYPVSGMSCAGCAANVQSALNDAPGVLGASVNFADSSARIEYAAPRTSPKELQEAVRTIGYDLIAREDETDAARAFDEEQARGLKRLRRATIGATLLTIPTMIIGMFLPDIPGANWIMGVLTLPVVFVFGARFFLTAWKQLLHGTSNMDSLVALSTAIAFLFSLFNTLYPEYWTSRGLEAHVYFEAAAAIVAFVLLGNFLEERARQNTSSALKKLMNLTPEQATRIDSEGRPEQVAIDRVGTQDLLLVKPGERIPADGLVRTGESYVDQSAMTGEPVPVHVADGATVYAGTINQKGSFRFNVTQVGRDTRLGRIVQAVRAAQSSKAPVQKLVDRVASVFVPAVLLVAFATFGAWVLFGGAGSLSHAILTAVTVLVIACPCALGLATPTAIMVGVGKGAEHNILLKDASSLEIAHKVDTVVLDKTGTITQGRPVVADRAWAETDANNRATRSLPLRALEENSEHPLSSALLRELGDPPATASDPISATSVQALPGLGVTGTFNGTYYFAGNERLLLEHEGVQDSSNLRAAAHRMHAAGQTVIYYGDRTSLHAVFGVADPIKEGSPDAIARLLSSGIDVHLLTGDNGSTAAKVAEAVGLTGAVRSDLLPADKADFVRKLKAEGRIVAMVGDGLNDSQALAEADLGIAMGQGSDIAMDVAGITLTTSDLGAIPRAFQLSRMTMSTLRQNLFWAFIYNLVGIPIAAGALYFVNGFLLNPMLAAAAMAFSSVSVVLNSLRLKSRQL